MPACQVIDLGEDLDCGSGELVNENIPQSLKFHVMRRHISFVVVSDVHGLSIFPFECEIEKGMQRDAINQRRHGVLRGAEHKFLAVGPVANFFKESFNP